MESREGATYVNNYLGYQKRLQTSVLYYEAGVGDASRDHRTPSQSPTKRDGVNGINR